MYTLYVEISFIEDIVCSIWKHIVNIKPVVEKRGDTTYIRDPLTIFTFDWVIHPSHPEAYMDRVINESGNIISESGIFVPLKESALEYVNHYSKNVKIVSESLGIDSKPISFTEDGRNVILKATDGRKAVVHLEDFLQKEMNSYLRKL